MARATRRTFLRSVVGSLIAGPLLAACGSSSDIPATAAPAGSPGPTVIATVSRSTPAAASGRVRIGYLPITDAAPLLLAHAKGYYQQQGLEADQPTMFRSWSQISEALQARQVDVVHLLMPISIWMRFGQQVPVKLVAWDHVNGSALTVAEQIERVEDLAGKTLAVPFWYSIHNVLIQMLLERAGLQPILRGDPHRTSGR